MDLFPHRSKHIGQEIAQDRSLLLVMGQNHQRYICENFPDQCHKVFLLGDFSKAQPGKDVEDPIGQPVDAYRKSYRHIHEAITGLVQWLVTERAKG